MEYPLFLLLANTSTGVGLEASQVSSLQVDYSDLDDDPEAEEPQKQLVYYELDLVCVAGVFPWAQHTIWSAILAE